MAIDVASPGTRQHTRDAASSVRPLGDRARDTAIFCGGIGGFFGACASTYRVGSVVPGVVFLGGMSAVASASFIGLRHAFVQGDFRKDGETVSGLAMGTVAMVLATAGVGRRVGSLAAGAGFLGGFGLHYAHRHWLYYRLQRDQSAPVDTSLWR